MNSPIISEHFLLKVDNWLLGQLRIIFKSSVNFHYSRYYDDFFISANSKSKLNDVKNILTRCIETYGMNMNYNKCKIVRTENTKILGLSFADGEIYPPKKLKQLMYEYATEYESLSEEDLDSVYAKMSMCGTIKGQNHYIVNNSSIPHKNHIYNIEYYSDELIRLTEKRDRFKYQLRN